MTDGSWVDIVWNFRAERTWETCLVGTSTYTAFLTTRRLDPFVVLCSSSESSSSTRFLPLAVEEVFGSCFGLSSSSSMADVSGVERVEALALNIGETAVVGVADAECPALARPRVTGMVDSFRVWVDKEGVVKFCVATRRDATRRALNLIYGRV